MNHISLEAGEDLLSKLLGEHVRLAIIFDSPSGTRTIMSGFLNSKTIKRGLIFLVSSPAIDVLQGFLEVPTAGRACIFEYAEIREVPLEIRKDVDEKAGDTLLSIRFTDLGERLLLFFTL
jgi:hypothetical protein